LGSPSGTTAIASYESSNGFDNDSLTFAPTSPAADIRTTTASTTYSGASGGGNFFLTNTVGTGFTISGINTSAYTSLTLSFGAYKSTTASNFSELRVEYSTNGTTFTALTIPAQPTGSGTANWRLITATGTIPSSSTLTLRFTNQGTSPQFRLDDITLSGVPEPSNILVGAVCAAGLLRRNRRRS
jgi:hypothetical protein